MCTDKVCKESEYRFYHEEKDEVVCYQCDNDFCPLGCYALDRCKKSPLNPSVETIPEKPEEYILSLSRQIESYDNYTKIFKIKIVDNVDTDNE